MVTLPPRAATRLVAIIDSVGEVLKPIVTARAAMWLATAGDLDVARAEVSERS